MGGRYSTGTKTKIRVHSKLRYKFIELMGRYSELMVRYSELIYTGTVT